MHTPLIFSELIRGCTPTRQASKQSCRAPNKPFMSITKPTYSSSSWHSESSVDWWGRTLAGSPWHLWKRQWSDSGTCQRSTVTSSQFTNSHLQDQQHCFLYIHAVSTTTPYLTLWTCETRPEDGCRAGRGHLLADCFLKTPFWLYEAMALIENSIWSLTCHCGLLESFYFLTYGLLGPQLKSYPIYNEL